MHAVNQIPQTFPTRTSTDDAGSSTLSINCRLTRSALRKGEGRLRTPCELAGRNAASAMTTIRQHARHQRLLRLNVTRCSVLLVPALAQVTGGGSSHTLRTMYN